MDEKVTINVKNMELTDRIKDYIDKKVPRLERLLPDLENVKFDLSFARNARNRADREISQITITGKNYVLRTEERDDDLLTAIDRAVDKIQRQIERFKGKRSRGRGDGAPASEVVPLPAEPAEPPVAIVRRKSFTLVPMDENEAIEQMALIAHEDFFIFYNVNTNSINVLYRRRDGDYGLIEPKLG
ncbi:MAG TPA: ribosome-associated translation inhibitor RaiA [Anaerolineaceae bacterium]|nr:ribosome-associated translation inhibitor RaiA [Anaerolineaceae bacterium]